jgi:hypothetical protein
MDAMRADPSSLLDLDDGETRRLLVRLASRSRLASRQLEIERWLDDWHELEVGRP